MSDDKSSGGWRRHSERNQVIGRAVGALMDEEYSCKRSRSINRSTPLWRARNPCFPAKSEARLAAIWPAQAGVSSRTLVVACSLGYGVGNRPLSSGRHVLLTLNR